MLRDLICFSLDIIEFGVSLNVLNPVENILEPDDGEYVIVTQCISAQLDYTLDRDAEFEFNISDASIAEFSYDFNNAQNITIPANFSGYFSVCLNTTVFGNDMFDGLRKIVYIITPLSVYDIATNPVIYILDNDGECMCTHTSLLAIAIPCQARCV